MFNLILFYVLTFVVGTVIGSFLNVVICRVPEKRPVAKGRSMCPHCKTVIKPIDLIPIVSFFALKRKCRQCAKPISWQYPLVELFTGLIFVFLLWHSGFSGGALFLRDLVFVSALIAIMIMDGRYGIIADAVVLPMIFFSAIVNVILLSTSTNLWSLALSLVSAAAFGALFFLWQYIVSKGKWIGAGDITFGLLIGLMVGWPNVLLALFIAYVLGAIVSAVLLIMKKKTLKGQLPFGVFLSVATFITLVYGTQIVAWYLGLIR
ncbi:MAG: prepilin peptidase [Parcubacteria group bacterium]